MAGEINSGVAEMKIKIAKDYECTECHAFILENDFDIVEDPRGKCGDEKWMVCPVCRTPENYHLLCQAEGCKLRYSVGTPTNKYGYLFLCSKHCEEVENEI